MFLRRSKNIICFTNSANSVPNKKLKPQISGFKVFSPNLPKIPVSITAVRPNITRKVKRYVPKTKATCTVNLSIDSVSGISLGAIASSTVSVNSPLSASNRRFLRFKILRYITPPIHATKNPTVAIVKPKLLPPAKP